MVVGPYFLSIIPAFVVEAIVDVFCGVDEPAVLEPGPDPLRPVVVERGVLRGRRFDAVGKTSCESEEELVGDGADVIVAFAPPQAAAGVGGVPAFGHVGEDGAASMKVVFVACDVVCSQPH